jgi:hypothetical protein
MTRKKPKEPKIRRPMLEDEQRLALALRDYCYTGHRLPVWHWNFVKAMAASPTSRATTFGPWRLGME